MGTGMSQLTGHALPPALICGIGPMPDLPIWIGGLTFEGSATKCLGKGGAFWLWSPSGQGLLLVGCGADVSCWGVLAHEAKHPQVLVPSSGSQQH